MVLILIGVILTTAALLVGCGMWRRGVGDALEEEMRLWSLQERTATTPPRSTRDAA